MDRMTSFVEDKVERLSKVKLPMESGNARTLISLLLFFLTVIMSTYVYLSVHGLLLMVIMNLVGVPITLMQARGVFSILVIISLLYW